MKQKRIAECKCNSLAPYSGKEANGKIEYNQERRTAFVPNEEIRQELITAVESKSWNEMLIFQQTSEEILNATLDMDTEEVAD